MTRSNGWLSLSHPHAPAHVLGPVDELGEVAQGGGADPVAVNEGLRGLGMQIFEDHFRDSLTWAIYGGGIPACPPIFWDVDHGA